jgi:hypothetical protein
MRAALYIDAYTIEETDVKLIIDEVHRQDRLVETKVCGDNFRKCKAKDIEDTGIKVDTEENTKECAEERYAICMARDTAVQLMLAVNDITSGKLVDKIYLATNDVCFVPLVNNLRKNGIYVTVIGCEKTDETLKMAADVFVCVEILRGEKIFAKADASEIAENIKAVITYYRGKGVQAKAETVVEAVKRRYPDFDVRNYGYTHLDEFLRENVKDVSTFVNPEGELCLELIEKREEIEKFSYDYLSSRGYKVDDMAELISALEEEFEGFAIENYGYLTDYGFVLSFSKFEIWNNKGIKMKRSFKLAENTANTENA